MSFYNTKSVTDVLAGVRVLLVEDNEMLQELTMEMLSDMGIEVVAASNGLEALDILDQDSNFDCILMDCQMPVMDGQTATKIIRQNPAFKDMFIFVMTGNLLFLDENSIREAGMNAVIIKPYTAEELVAALQKSLWPKANAA